MVTVHSDIQWLKKYFSISCFLLKVTKGTRRLFDLATLEVFFHDFGAEGGCVASRPY